MKEIEHRINYSLKAFNTLRIESVADDIYLPKTMEEIELLLANLNNPIIVGSGSNILFSSSGVKQPVIVTKYLNKVIVNPPFIEAQAGVSTIKLSNMAFELKLTGFEFLIGLPATLGGAVAMNAGANAQAISDYFISAKIYDTKEDKILELSRDEMEFSYRSSLLKRNPGRYVLLSAKFELAQADSYIAIKQMMDEAVEKRKNTQPTLKEPNIGCAFKNPVKDGQTISAGKLIDETGLKGHLEGGAMVYFNHANFIINFNEATSMDYINLMREMQRLVFDKFDIMLEPEVIYIGSDKKELELWNTLIKG